MPEYTELARRLCAAYISHQLGNKGVDYTLKRYVSDVPGTYWLHLAETVANAGIGSKHLGPDNAA